VAQVMSFSIKKNEQGLIKSLRRYAKANDMNVSQAIKSILAKRLARAGYDV
jgi:hypothetical protein